MPGHYDDLLAEIGKQYAKTATFVRAAFHVHTVDSFDWGKEADPTLNDATNFVGAAGQERFLEALEEAGLELVCITDHMKCQYAADLSALSRNREGVLVLPGIEISVSFGPNPADYIHVLAVFDAGTAADVIERVWGVQNRIPSADQRTGREVAHFDNLRELRDNVRDAGGLFLLAHVEQQPRGHRAHFRSELGQTVGMFAVDPDGKVEKTAISNQYAGHLVDLNPDAIEVMKGDDRRHYLHVISPAGDEQSFAGIARSDHHSVETMKTPDAVTHVKVSTQGLRCVRDALRFQETRIRFDEDVPDTPSPRLVGLRLRGGGLFPQATIAFNENLNCLIGARGSGKSTVVEALRYVLGQRAALEAVQGGGSERSYAALAIGTQNANLAESQIELVYERAGERHVLSSIFGTDTRVYTLDGDDCRVPPESISSSYPARIFSWSELETLGRQPRLQREVIDRLVDGLPALLGKKADLLAALSANRDEVVAIRHSLEARLRTADGALRHYAERSLRFRRLNTDEVRDLFSEIDRRRQRIALLDDIDDELAEVAQLLKALGEIDPAVAANERVESDNEDVREWWQQAAAPALNFGGLRDRIAAGATDLTAEVGLRRGVIDNLKFAEQQTLDRAEAALREQTREDPGAAVAHDQREQARKAFDEATAIREAYIEDFEGLSQMLAARGNLLSRLADVSAEIAEARRGVATDLSGRLDELHVGLSVVVEVGEGEDRTDWIGALHAFMNVERGGHYAKKELPERLAALGPTRLVDAIISGNATVITGGDLHRPVAEDEAARLVAAFTVFSEDSEAEVTRVSEELDELLSLQEAVIDDVVRIYSAGQPVDQLSPGGRSSAMLPLIAMSEDVPLVIDQPEDNLDNRMVGNTLSRILATLKEHRQIIVTTHNPNIVVGGDAEQVVVLDAAQARPATVNTTGSIDDDDVIEAVIKIMEGGKDAFRERGRRYTDHLY